MRDSKLARLTTRTRAVSAAVFAVLISVGLGAAPSSADKLAPNGRVDTSGQHLIVRRGPTTEAPEVGKLRDGTLVTIRCTLRGERVSGKFGTSSLWNYVGNGFISDTFTWTGSSSAVAPTCSGRVQQTICPGPAVYWCSRVLGLDPDDTVSPPPWREVPKGIHEIGEEAELLALKKVQAEYGPLGFLVWRPKDHAKGACVFPRLLPGLPCLDIILTGYNPDFFKSIWTPVARRYPDIVAARRGEVILFEVKSNDTVYEGKQREADDWIYFNYGWPTVLWREQVATTRRVCNTRACAIA